MTTLDTIYHALHQELSTKYTTKLYPNNLCIEIINDQTSDWLYIIDKHISLIRHNRTWCSVDYNDPEMINTLITLLNQ